MFAKIIDFVGICKTEESYLFFSLRGSNGILCFKPIKVLIQYAAMK